MNKITIDNKQYYIMTDLDLTNSFDFGVYGISRYIFHEIFLHQHELYEQISMMQQDGVTGLFFITLRKPTRIPSEMLRAATFTPLTGKIKGYYLTPKERN